VKEDQDVHSFDHAALRLGNGRSIQMALPKDSTDPVVNAYKSGQALNEYLIDLLVRFTRPGDFVLDLGCHVGTLSVPAACLGRNVVAVDASRLHAAAVHATATMNELGNLSVECCAVGAADGEVTFDENGLWGMVVLDDAVSANTSRVRVRRADAILASAGWSRVDMVKMDVEGSELAAIESLGKYLGGDNAPVIIYESNGMTFEVFGYSIQTMREKLELLGYRTYRVEGSRLVYCPPDELQPEAWLDLVALPAKIRHKCENEIDTVWAQEAVVRRCIEWGSNEHRNVRQYLHAAMFSFAKYPRFDPRIVELRAALLEEFGETGTGQDVK